MAYYNCDTTVGKAPYKYHQYVCDTIADMSKISLTENCPGSTVIVLKPQYKEYVLGADYNWHLKLVTATVEGGTVDIDETELKELLDQVETLSTKLEETEAKLKESESTVESLNALLQEAEEKISVLDEYIEILQDSTYSGETQATPQANSATVLETANKILLDDITINEIPVSEAGNESGGVTVSIAS